MKVSVASLQPVPLQLEATDQPADIGLEAEHVAFPAPVKVSVKLTRMQQEVLAKGEATTTARVQCSRCLAEVDLPLSGSFEALFVPKDREPDEQRRHDHDDQHVSFYSEFTVDLSDEIVQCLLLELPMRLLCAPDCAGLCPQCGQNLNEGSCNCKPDEPADTWAALRDLFPPKDDGSRS